MKERFSLDFPTGSKEKFNRIRLLAGLTTLTELFRHAISTYEFLLQQQKSGWCIVLEKDG
jgi:hypothetical protein